MYKYLFILVSVIGLSNKGFSMNIDTPLVYLSYRPDLNLSVKVSTLDSADFLMIILPPDSGDNRFNIKQYYKNGAIKLIGKSGSDIRDIKFGRFLFTGDYVAYYPNGKKQSISHYNAGYKEGFEYLYYKDGKLECVKKYAITRNSLFPEALNWECYDLKGNMICKDGNGLWVIYDNFKNIVVGGPVSNGYKEGEWQGTVANDSVKYVYKYRKNRAVSSIAYDKEGNAYPFSTEIEGANFKRGPIVFIQILRNRLHLPRDVNGKKVSIDTAHISFVVNRDGHLSNFETLGDLSPEIKNSLVDAIAKCGNWLPGTFYGIPCRTKVILPLKYLEGYMGTAFYSEEVTFKENMIGL